MKKFLLFLLGAVSTLIVVTALRWTYFPEKVATHFHANFAIFVSGKRIDLSDKKYMEDVGGCRPDHETMYPEDRVHMHNGEDMVVHVHEPGVTWAHFFSSLGFSFGNSYFAIDDERIYRSAGRRTLKYIVNGKRVDNPMNQLIASEDKLLISFGSESLSRVMQDQWSKIPSNAHEHNEHPDPGSCSGAFKLSFWEKLKKVLWY